MPHRCVKCGKMYKDGAKELLTGCNYCGSKFFYFLKESSIKKNIVVEKLTDSEIKEIERDVKEIVGVDELDKPVILDLETIRIIKPGRYEIDLTNAFNTKTIVYKVKDGKYVIDLSALSKTL